MFQSPLKEGANIITASTHKTFPGPQGGIIISNLDEKKVKKVDRNMFPGIVSNHHLHRIPILLLTAKLLDESYSNYATNVIKNARFFAEKLFENGFEVEASDFGFTETHQVVLNVSKLGGGTKVANILERNNIIVNKNALPFDSSVVNPSGIRIGVQEMTLKGFNKDDFEILANRFKDILLH